MGRLQRKKKTVKKKTQKSDTVSAPSAQTESLNKPTAAAASGTLQKKQPPAPQRKTSATAPEKKNFIDKSIQFLREVKAELKKVTWPSRKQTIGSTVLVIVVVMIISLFLGAVDMILSSSIRLILQ